MVAWVLRVVAKKSDLFPYMNVAQHKREYLMQNLRGNLLFGDISRVLLGGCYGVLGGCPGISW